MNPASPAPQFGDQTLDGVLRRPVLNLVPGDRIDLSGDPLADPKGTDPNYQYEWAVVEAVVQETPEAVTVYNGQMNFCFPAGHMIEVDPDQTPEERAAALIEALDGWRPGDYCGPEGEEPYIRDLRRLWRWREALAMRGTLDLSAAGEDDARALQRLCSVGLCTYDGTFHMTQATGEALAALTKALRANAA